MKNHRVLKSLSLLVLATAMLAVPAQAQSGAAMGIGGMKGEATKPMIMDKGMDMKPMMMDMQDKMSAMKPSGNVDVDFAMMMRVHHQSAISMAEAELQNGKNPQMRVMAKDIIRAQKKEIAAFDKFLEKRGEKSMKMADPAMQMKK